MKVTLILIQLIGVISAMYNSASSKVETLTAATFDKLVLKSDEIWFVEFYAPWCGHCKSLEPHWDKAARQLKGVVRFGAIDCDAEENKSIAGKYGIQGFPTIKIFGLDKKMPPLDYGGQRESKDIIAGAIQTVTSEVTKRTGAKQKAEKKSSGGSKSSGGGGSGSDEVVVLDSSNFDTLVMGSKDIWMVEFYAPWCGHCKALEPEWVIASGKLKGQVKLGKVDADEQQNKELAARFGVQGFPTIKVFGYGAKTDASAVPYNGARQAQDIVNFGNDLADKADIEPEVHELFKQKVYDENCKGTTICVISFLPNIFDSNAKERNGYLDTLKKVAKKNRKHPFNYFWLGAGDQLDLERNLGLGFGFPAVILVQPQKKKFGIMRSSFSEKNMNEFLSSTLTKGMSLDSIPGDMKFKKADKWDGKDAPVLEEEDYGSYEDL